MAAIVRVEFVSVGYQKYDGVPDGAIKGVAPIAYREDVGATATTAGNRIVAPSFGGGSLARISVPTGNVVVMHGADPTATQTAGLAILQGNTVLLSMKAGEKLSFIELDLA